MANKHEKQRDFHKRTRLTDAALNGIKGTTESSINKLYRPEYREKDEYILPNGISTSYSVVKTMDDLDKNKDKSHSEETGR
ncbi:MAG: hypothetical protein HFJ40_07940 [Clostridia bacterium]|nr:hypothetical protein [Clostridia bacterium]